MNSIRVNYMQNYYIYLLSGQKIYTLGVYLNEHVNRYPGRLKLKVNYKNVSKAIDFALVNYMYNADKIEVVNAD